MAANLDSLDKKILCYIEHNGRASLSEIARRLKRGRDTIEYRYQKLVQTEVIQGFRAVLNPAAFGLTLYKSYIRLSNDRKRITAFIEKAKKHPFVFWVVEVSGEFDLIVSIGAESPFEFHQIQESLFSCIADLIHSLRVFPVSTFWDFPKKYLGESTQNAFEIGGKPKKILIDKIDYIILKNLSIDARIPISRLSQILKLTDPAIATRIQRLEKQKVILGYNAELNLLQLGLTNFKTQLYTRAFDQKIQKRFFDYAKFHPSISCYVEQLGGARQEIEIHVESYNQYLLVINDIRENFPDYIRNISTIIMGKEHFHWMLVGGGDN